MTTLHTINKAPSDTSLWQSCLSAILPGDALLMIENGVYAATQTSIIKQLQSINGISLYLLSPDIDARGLTEQIRTEAILVNDQQFVELCCQHTKVVSWF